MTDELGQTRNIPRAAPPKLVEPPAPVRLDATAPIAIPRIADGVHPVAAAATVPVSAIPPAEPAAAAVTAEPALAPDAAPAPVPVPTPEPAPAPLGPYRLRMADGVVVDLDLTVYLGRRPSVPRIASDRRVRLVAVPSARKEVSSTHLEIRLTSDAVVATDMRSTNGSVVSVPGSAPRTLLRGESAVVTPGSLIDLGDGNVLEVLPRERPRPAEEALA